MLTIHRSERADRLVDALAAILLDPLDDPFTPEVVAVPDPRRRAMDHPAAVDDARDVARTP